MRISVAIVNWNTRDLLSDCLASLKDHISPAHRIEIIVVDNGSADGSADIVANRFPAVKLIRNNDNVGFTKAVNQAYAVSSGEYFLLFNSDAYLKDDTLSLCADYLDARSDIAVLGCRLEYPNGSTQSSCFRFTSLRGILLTALYLSQTFKRSYYLNWDRYGSAEWSQPQEVDCVMGSFMMVRRSAIEDGDLLDPGYFMYGEEKDLCYRLHRRGLRTVFYPYATVVHHHFGSSSKPKVAAWVYEMKRRAKLRFLWKWRGTTVSWLANLIMTVELLPRCVAWALGDLASAVRSGGAVPDRLLKLRALRFHLAALFRVSLLASEWEPDE